MQDSSCPAAENIDVPSCDPAQTGTTTMRMEDLDTPFLCRLVADSVNILSARQANAMRAKGFYKDYDFLLSILDFIKDDDKIESEAYDAAKFALDRLWKLTKIALEISEYGELVEAIRKGKPGVPLPSDHLPNHSMEEEETADVFIRTLDRAGFSEIDFGGAFAEKMAYNLGREHQHGGKGV